VNWRTLFCFPGNLASMDHIHIDEWESLPTEGVKKEDRRGYFLLGSDFSPANLVKFGKTEKFKCQRRLQKKLIGQWQKRLKVRA